MNPPNAINSCPVTRGDHLLHRTPMLTHRPNVNAIFRSTLECTDNCFSGNSSTHQPKMTADRRTKNWPPWSTPDTPLLCPETNNVSRLCMEDLISCILFSNIVLDCRCSIHSLNNRQTKNSICTTAMVARLTFAVGNDGLVALARYLLHAADREPAGSKLERTHRPQFIITHDAE